MQLLSDCHDRFEIYLPKISLLLFVIYILVVQSNETKPGEMPIISMKNGRINQKAGDTDCYGVTMLIDLKQMKETY